MCSRHIPTGKKKLEEEKEMIDEPRRPEAKTKAFAKAEKERDEWRERAERAEWQLKVPVERCREFWPSGMTDETLDTNQSLFAAFTEINLASNEGPLSEEFMLAAIQWIFEAHLREVKQQEALMIPKIADHYESYDAGYAAGKNAAQTWDIYAQTIFKSDLANAEERLAILIKENEVLIRDLAASNEELAIYLEAARNGFERGYKAADIKESEAFDRGLAVGLAAPRDAKAKIPTPFKDSEYH
jgi:hypothetical protein